MARGLARRRLIASFLWLVLLSSSGAGTLSISAFQGTEAIESGRPVEEAMGLLARQLGWNITYEDPPYVNADDLRDITVNNSVGGRLIVPRGGRVTLPDNVLAIAATEDPIALLESVRGTEQMVRGPVKRFKVVRSGSMFHVVPTKLLEANGEWRPVVPVSRYASDSVG